MIEVENHVRKAIPDLKVQLQPKSVEVSEEKMAKFRKIAPAPTSITNNFQTKETKSPEIDTTNVFTNKPTEISAIQFEKIQEILVVLQEIMQCEDKTSETYQNLVQKLPIDFRNKYHILIQASISYPECSIFGQKA